MSKRRQGQGRMTAEDSSFDYIIVGGGSAGAVLANRLSADPALRICLIEAGPIDRSPLISLPLGVIWLSKDPRHNWLFSTTPQQGLNGRQVSVPRGKVLGGSSAINGMIYIRGHRADYDAWAAAGCTGWGYDDVLPYFKRSEANQSRDVTDETHGRSGPLTVSNLRSPSPVDHMFIEAAGQLQHRPCPDFNAAEPEGVGIYQVTQQNGRRHSTGAAFLAPQIRARSNLTILTGAEARRITLENGRATGLSIHHNGTDRTLNARAEIILAAGAIGSPDILLRSGIGPAQQLYAAGLPLAHDLPGVGRNLQDHVDVMVICQSQSREPYGLSIGALPRLAREGLHWITGRRGMLTSNMVEAGGFVRTSPSEPRPDIQFHLIPGRKSHRGRMFEYGHGVSLHTCVLRPDSRGAVTRITPDGPPIIDLGLLSDPRDLARLTKGVAMARDILRRPPFAPLGLSEIIPGENVTDLTHYIRDNARTVYHPVGTCAMGTGPDAVVDPHLRVHGIQGLRVADASIMPTIVSGNTNAPAIMIGEKAADLILNARKTG
jgi:choline dehydrogenase